jgi:hypothetical protein
MKLCSIPRTKEIIKTKQKRSGGIIFSNGLLKG